MNIIQSINKTISVFNSPENNIINISQILGSIFDFELDLQSNFMCQILNGFLGLLVTIVQSYFDTLLALPFNTFFCIIRNFESLGVMWALELYQVGFLFLELMLWIMWILFRIAIFSLTLYAVKKQVQRMFKKRFFKMPGQSFRYQSKQDQEICSICYEEFKYNQECTMLRCSMKHIFHSQCLKIWLLQKSICPMCRQRT